MFSKTAFFSAAENCDQPDISAMLREQPMQSWVKGFNTQIWLQGEAGWWLLIMLILKI